MNRNKLRVQAACVLTLVGLVGWPQYRSIRAVTVWRSAGPLTPRPELIANDPRVAEARGPGLVRVGYGSLANRRGISLGRRLRGGRPSADSAGSGVRGSAIGCRARTSLNQPVPHARLVLRNITTGRIEARATADDDGRCSFLDVASSGYVIELVGSDSSVIASSELLTVGDGETRQANVLVSSDATIGALFGAMQPGASEPLARAVETGTQGVGLPVATNSPQQ